METRYQEHFNPNVTAELQQDTSISYKCKIKGI